MSASDDPELYDSLAEALRRYAAMTPEEQAAMQMAHLASLVRAMTTPCEHGVLDFEQCPDCRRMPQTEGGR